MPPVVSFIGWHNSGKTTLTSQVVARLKEKGYTVAVIKSTKEQGIDAEQPQTDTAIYRRVGADRVALLAPDQLIIRSRPPAKDLAALVQSYFFDMDIVIAEGFKHAVEVPKIEVRRGGDEPLLRDQVAGVVAVATDQPLTGGIVFGLDQSREIADFIETRFLTNRDLLAPPIALTVNGDSIPLPESVRRQLTAAILAVLAPTHPATRQGTWEVNVHCPQQPTQRKQFNINFTQQ